MQRSFKTALDRCLARLGKGESVESCLQQFPRQRHELEPLLRAAQMVRDSHYRADPSEEALARIRARFMVKVSEKTTTKAPQRHIKWPGWRGNLAVSRGVATLALTIVLIVGTLGGGGIVSANSLPGDFLYGAKRASESVRLFLTIDAESQANLQREYAQRRVAEIKQVVVERREVDVDLTGIVDSIEGDTVIIEGISVHLPPEIADEDRPAVGVEVYVAARTQEDGTVTAKSLAVRAQPTNTAGTTDPLPITETATEPAKPEPTNSISEDKPTVAPTLPMIPSGGVTRAPTKGAGVTELPVKGITAAATSTITSTATVMPTATVTKVLTCTPAATSAPPPREIRVRIEGQIDAIGSQSWTVDGRQIMLQASTRIKQENALAQVGGWALVDAIKQADGQLVAREILIIRGPEQPPQPREFHGVIESMAEGEWVIAGQHVLIVAETVIEGSPEIGAKAHVEAELHADGRLIAKRITVEAPAEQVMQFKGLIQSISDDQWVIAGQTVQVNSETQIEGEGKVGEIAEVEVVIYADGSQWARHITIVSQPAMTATTPPTTAPTVPGPIPDPTATNTAEATSDPSPTAEPTDEIIPGPPTATPDSGSASIIPTLGPTATVSEPPASPTAEP